MFAKSVIRGAEDMRRFGELEVDAGRLRRRYMASREHDLSQCFQVSQKVLHYTFHY